MKASEADPGDPWTMPDWMERYRPLICNTGGNTIERLMSLTERQRRANLILASLELCVSSQIALLFRLRAAGLLADEVKA